MDILALIPVEFGFFSTVVIAVTSIVINLLAMTSATKSKRVYLLLFGNLNLITLAALLVINADYYYVWSLTAINMFILHVFPLSRCRKLFSKQFYYFSIIVFLLDCVSIYFIDYYDDYVALFIASIVTSVISWICGYYCYFSIGKLIRSSPLSKYDSQKKRIERLSNIILLLGGLTDIISIISGFMGLIPIFSFAIGLFIDSTSDYLFELNKELVSTSQE